MIREPEAQPGASREDPTGDDMGAPATRGILLWSGWFGLLLAFMPFSWTSREAGLAGAPDLPWFSFPYIGDLPRESMHARFTIGLPFSPWFRFERDVRAETTPVEDAPAGPSIQVTTADRQPAPRVEVQVLSAYININDSWAAPVPNGSAVLALLSIALLILARWQRRRTNARPGPAPGAPQQA
jgi:hypothetical protein